MPAGRRSGATGSTGLRCHSTPSIKQLMPRSKKDIDAALVQSGYKPDSALSATDVQLLAKTLSIDEVLDGSVEKTANGYRVNVRLFMLCPLKPTPFSKYQDQLRFDPELWCHVLRRNRFIHGADLIRSDPDLKPEEREALLRIYRSFVEGRSSTA